MFPFPKPSRFRRSGFSLVEILVVSGIILSLGAIGIPSVKSAFKRSLLAKDLSNLRQIHAATAMFVGDNGGYYPTCHSGTGSGAWTAPYWSDQLEPYLPRKNATGTGRSPVLFSPAFTTNHTIAGYGANSFVIAQHQQDPITGAPKKISSLSLAAPAKTILFANSGKVENGVLKAVFHINGYVAQGTPESKTEPRPWPVHSGNSFAAIFCDGHAEAIAFQEYLTNSTAYFGEIPK